MDMKIRKVMQVLGVILAIFLAANVYAEQGGKHHFNPKEKGKMKENMEGHFEKVAKELNLTPEQKEQLKQHKAQNREKTKELHKSIADKMKELGSELQKAELDMQKIYQLHAELKALRAEMEDSRLEGILKVRSILTPEQFKKFGEFTKKGKGGRKGHKQMGRGGECDMQGPSPMEDDVGKGGDQ